MSGDVQADRSGGVEPEVAVEPGKMGEHHPVAASHREEAAGIGADPGIKALEIFRQDGGLDHADEAAVVGVTAAADPEEARPLIGRARRQRDADKCADVLVDMGIEVVAVRKALLRRRRGKAVDQRPSVRVEDPGRFQLRQRIGQLLQAAVQGRLAPADDVVGQATHHLVELGEAAVDRLEHLERVLMRDIEGALDLAVGDVFRRGVGDQGGDREQRNRQRQGCSHHPLQQSQRIALRALHGRSGPTPETLLEFRAGKEAACGDRRLQSARIARAGGWR